MQCPRLNHFVRFNTNGSVSPCGHMINAPQFDSLDQMQTSQWLHNIKQLMDQDQWPAECLRCQEVEQQGQLSIRRHAITLALNTAQQDYLQVGGVLDNLCNAACITCNENHSTRIGHLQSKVFPIVDNSQKFWSLPQDRIVHLDINGGEPSYSKNYQKILNQLPPNLKTLRLNTNGARVLKELEQVVAKGIEVTVTVSCDGIGSVHDLLRWPIPWEKFYNNLLEYKTMPVNLNLWTTVSKLNLHDLPNIQEFAVKHAINHSYAYLKDPWELCIDNPDETGAQAYISKQKQLRGLS